MDDLKPRPFIDRKGILETRLLVCSRIRLSSKAPVAVVIAA